MKKFVIFFIVICVIFLFVFNVFLFPTKYRNEIMVYSQTYNFAPELIASVINVESGYNTNAKSGKGAVGLMQILPSTAEWVCQKYNLTYTNEILTKPQNNIEIGTIYLNYLNEKFNNLDVALCAYNAGEGVVSEWLKNENYSGDGTTLKSIPYKETKNYLQKIKNHEKVYKMFF